MKVKSELYASNLQKVLAHMAAEFSNDIDQIMETVDPNPRFAVLFQEPNGLDFQVPTTTAGVREHYQSLRSAVDVLRSRQIRRIVTEWFVFQQSIATMRTAVGDGHETPIEFNVDSAVFFPVGPDRIIGEVPWNRTGFEDAAHGRGVQRPRSNAELLEILDNCDAVIDHWLKADVDAILSFFVEEVRCATRGYSDVNRPMMIASNKDEFRRSLQPEFQALNYLSATIINRIVTDWYVFVDVMWTAESLGGTDSDTRVEFRTANILPLDDDGSFRATLGYGTDLIAIT